MLRAPYENLMPDDLRWSWGSDASAGGRLQIQIIISREVWLHRDHNKSGTRKEELLLKDKELKLIWEIRRYLSKFDNVSATKQLINKVKSTKSNEVLIKNFSLMGAKD